jgi:histidinol phosphatase-like PHP family hydrolase
LTVKELIRSVAEKGILDYGLTDHFHTPFNLPDLAASRKEYDACHPPTRFHFGVEASCVSQWELEQIATGKYDNPINGLRSGGPTNGPLALGLTDTHIEAYRIEYVIGAVHRPMYIPLEREMLIRDCHRQNMFLASHPLVTIIGHPWHWGGPEPWLDDFGVIPDPMHDEFAEEVIGHHKVVEINLMMLLDHGHTEKFRRQYLDYFAWLRSRGVDLCAASDCHTSEHFHELELATASRLLASVGIRDADLWRLPQV